MKKATIVMAFIAGFGVMAHAGNVMAKDVTESRDHTAFEKIHIDGTGVGIDVKVGEDFSVSLKGSEKWLKKTVTKVEGDTLVISRKNKKKIKNLDSDNRIIITMPKFAGLEVDGAVDADISGVDSEKLKFEINGAGNIDITGNCAELNVILNGAANFEGPDLKCEVVLIRINGVGNVEAYGSKSADLEINGMGNIDLYGNPPEVKRDNSLFSKITIHE
ncbi:MAG: DUF2807 domain-containing protein [Emcibacter sp.]|nr:DUF2807 domain-containing protein [Emcibacter sp.]